IAEALASSGASARLADMAIRLVGKGSPTLAFMLMGWIVAISVPCETGFIALNPARKAAVRRAGASGVSTAAGLGSGLYVSSALFPLAGVPLASALALGLGESLPLLFLLAVAVSIPALAGAYLLASRAGKRHQSEEDIEVAKDMAERYGRLALSRGKLPGRFLSLAPVLAPLALVALGSIRGAAGWAGPFWSVAGFFLNPIGAMIVGLAFAAALLARSGKAREFNPATEATLKTAGPMLCAMGAGGAFGHLAAESGLAELAALAASGAQGQGLGQGLLVSFLLAAAIKTVHGSSAIALAVAAGIVAPLSGALGLDSPAASALAFLALGAGSMLVSHANDPYFWIVSRLSGLSPRQAYLSHSAAGAAAGLCCMAGVLALSLFLR
ncbi:MAG: GntP family permease, partial [Treponema sp.]|nr:GntP family permease [Treponema sp.]